MSLAAEDFTSHSSPGEDASLTTPGWVYRAMQNDRLKVDHMKIAGQLMVQALPLEISMVRREYENGLFHLLSWYLAKNVSDLPMQILMLVVLFVSAYCMIGIGHGAAVFALLLLFMVLARTASVGLAYATGCFFRRADPATAVGMIILLPMLLFGGLLVNSSDTPVHFVWINYISPIKFGFDATMRIYWEQVDEIPCDQAAQNCIARTGDEVLANYTVSGRPVLVDAMLLVLLNVWYRALGFLALWINVHSAK